MKSKGNSGLVVIAFFVFMVFCISTANAETIWDRIPGQIEMQRLIINAFNGIITGFQRIDTDTLYVDKIVTFGDGSASVDFVIHFNGETYSGTITYMEDEDRFDFDNDIAVAGKIGGATLNTGQGNYELYAMNQDLESTDSPTFEDIVADSTYFRIANITGNLKAVTYGSDATVTDAELLYINSLSSNAQTQLTALVDSTDALGILVSANQDSLDAAGLLISANSDSIDTIALSLDQGVKTTDDVNFAMINNTVLQTTTLGIGVTTWAATSNIMTITGDGGANTVATITGAGIGIYTIIFVDGLITVTDTDAHTANTIDLLGTATDLTSADDTTLTLVYDGTSFYEVSRSVN